MKKVLAFVIINCIIVPLIFCSCYGMKDLPEGELLASHDSPSGEYTINIYLCGGGATVAYSIRGELFNNTDNTKKIFIGTIGNLVQR